jgi:hypothetical protein
VPVIKVSRTPDEDEICEQTEDQDDATLLAEEFVENYITPTPKVWC